MSTVSIWECAEQGDEYRDFECSIPDTAYGVGGFIRITLVDEQGKPPSAYGTIQFDTQDWEIIAEGIEFNIDRDAAERTVGLNLNTQEPHP